MNRIGDWLEPVRQRKPLLLNWGLAVVASNLLMTCITLVIDAPIRTGLIAASMAVTMSRLMRHGLGLTQGNSRVPASWRLLIRRSQNSTTTNGQRLQRASGVILGLLLLVVMNRFVATDKTDMSIGLGLIVGLATSAIIQDLLPSVPQ